MRRVWNILVFAFFIFCLLLFKPREDVVFAAINKSQCIRLFEKGRDFDLCVEESMHYTGTYSISKDTIFLSYREQRDPSRITRNMEQSDLCKMLPLKLVINESASNITACDGNAFSAEVYLDQRQKTYHTAPRSARLLDRQKSIISAIASP